MMLTVGLTRNANVPLICTTSCPWLRQQTSTAMCPKHLPYRELIVVRYGKKIEVYGNVTNSCIYVWSENEGGAAKTTGLELRKWYTQRSHLEGNAVPNHTSKLISYVKQTAFAESSEAQQPDSCETILNGLLESDAALQRHVNLVLLKEHERALNVEKSGQTRGQWQVQEINDVLRTETFSRIWKAKEPCPACWASLKKNSTEKKKNMKQRKWIYKETKILASALHQSITRVLFHP